MCCARWAPPNPSWGLYALRPSRWRRAGHSPTWAVHRSSMCTSPCCSCSTHICRSTWRTCGRGTCMDAWMHVHVHVHRCMCIGVDGIASRLDRWTGGPTAHAGHSVVLTLIIASPLRLTPHLAPSPPSLHLSPTPSPSPPPFTLTLNPQPTPSPQVCGPAAHPRGSVV